MKKILAILLAMLPVLSMGMVAFAADDDLPTEEPPAGDTPAISTTATATLKKVYKKATPSTAEDEDPVIVPNETLSFSATSDTPNAPALTFTTVQVAETDSVSAEYAITVTADTTDVPYGVYEYTITEDTPTTLSQGEDYSAEEIEVKLYVFSTQDPVISLTTLNTVTTDDEEDKQDTFTNAYNVGDLTVTKQIEGNLADPNVAFEITVTFTAANTVNNTISYTEAGEEKSITTGWTGNKSVTLNLVGGAPAVFTNIPEGVTYTVVENSRYQVNKDKPSEENDPEKGYTVTYANSDNDTTETGVGSIEAGDADTVTITNKKEAGIETGVILDSLPYILVMGIVLAGAAIMMIRRRKANED